MRIREGDPLRTTPTNFGFEARRFYVLSKPCQSPVPAGPHPELLTGPHPVSRDYIACEDALTVVERNLLPCR